MKAYVYRSRPDGSQMSEWARLDLAYGRRPAGWTGWANAAEYVGKSRGQVGYGVGPPGALLSDILPRPDGRLTLGLRDRTVDLAPSLYRLPVREWGSGDTLTLLPGSPEWTIENGPDLYDDLPFGGVDEAMMGGRKEVEYAYRILEEGSSADRQLRVFRETGSLKSVVDHLIHETEEGVL